MTYCIHCEQLTITSRCQTLYEFKTGFKRIHGIQFNLSICIGADNHVQVSSSTSQAKQS
jgi:hypothetical protein